MRELRISLICNLLQRLQKGGRRYCQVRATKQGSIVIDLASFGCSRLYRWSAVVYTAGRMNDHSHPSQSGFARGFTRSILRAGHKCSSDQFQDDKAATSNLTQMQSSDHENGIKTEAPSEQAARNAAVQVAIVETRDSTMQAGGRAPGLDSREVAIQVGLGQLPLGTDQALQTPVGWPQRSEASRAVTTGLAKVPLQWHRRHGVQRKGCCLLPSMSCGPLHSYEMEMLQTDTLAFPEYHMTHFSAQLIVNARLF